MTRLAARIGAIFYVIWGIVHLVSSYYVALLGQKISPAVVVQGRVFQDAWVLLFGGIVAIIIAVTMNWRNSKTGFWINLVMVSLIDIAFIFFIMVPGYVPLWPGLEGPIAWVVAGVSTAVGVFGTQNRSLGSSDILISQKSI